VQMFEAVFQRGLDAGTSDAPPRILRDKPAKMWSAGFSLAMHRAAQRRWRAGGGQARRVDGRPSEFGVVHDQARYLGAAENGRNPVGSLGLHPFHCGRLQSRLDRPSSLLQKRRYTSSCHEDPGLISSRSGVAFREHADHGRWPGRFLRVGRRCSDEGQGGVEGFRHEGDRNNKQPRPGRQAAADALRGSGAATDSGEGAARLYGTQGWWRWLYVPETDQEKNSAPMPRGVAPTREHQARGPTPCLPRYPPRFYMKPIGSRRAWRGCAPRLSPDGGASRRRSSLRPCVQIRLCSTATPPSAEQAT